MWVGGHTAASRAPHNAATESLWSPLIVDMRADIAVENRGPKAGLLKSVRPYVAVAAVVVTGAVLGATIYFTLLDLQWVAFLAGILLASILAMTARAARAEQSAASNLGRLSLAEYQMAGQAQRHVELEQQLVAARVRLRFSDEQLPIMLAFVDQDTRYRFHNRAFGGWLGLSEEKIQGQHMREVLGRKVYSEIEPYVLAAANGQVVRYERTHKAADGALFQLAVQYLPRFAEDGGYAGFYVAITDVTERRHVSARSAAPAPGSAGEPDDAGQRILAAINGNEFTLLCHRIVPLSGDPAAPGHYELLIRLLEEESGMVPPGAFFPLAEEFGLLPQLDRWVVSNLLDWIAGPDGAAIAGAGSVYFVNVAAATLSDPDFPEFLELQLRRTGVPGKAVCFEIDEADLVRKRGDADAFARQARLNGCRIAISGFGESPQSLGLLKQFPADFVKINGSIVRLALAYPVPRAKVAATVHAARAIGARTVAEMVEDEGTLAMLRASGVDFAQGFGISLPQRLTEPRWPAVRAAA